MDRFPDDLFGEIRRLTARVEALEAQLRARPALTAASQGWLMSNRSVPSVSSGEIHIGCNAGDFYVSTASGTKRIPGVAAAVTAPNPTLSNAPGTYDQAHSQQLAVACDDFRIAWAALIPALKTAGLMAFS